MINLTEGLPGGLTTPTISSPGPPEGTVEALQNNTCVQTAVNIQRDISVTRNNDLDRLIPSSNPSANIGDTHAELLLKSFIPGRYKTQPGFIASESKGTGFSYE